MDSLQPANGHNIYRQLAIVEVARQAKGRTIPEIKQMLREEFDRLGLPQQPGPWLEAVASEAWYGKPYIVDLDASAAATSMMAKRQGLEPALARPYLDAVDPGTRAPDPMTAQARLLQEAEASRDHRSMLLMQAGLVLASFLAVLGTLAAARAIRRSRQVRQLAEVWRARRTA